MTEQKDKLVLGARQRRRRLLMGCGITLGVLLIAVLIAWWLVSRHLGAILSDTVKEQADAVLNGRLEFVSLEVDLAGRAVMSDVAVYMTGEELPVLTSPRVVVEFDLLNLIGPNRGRRAVVVTLHEPGVLLTREPTGTFNLARLAKERPEEEAFQKMGVALHLHDATIDFTDWCLLDQDYPKLPPADGLAAALLDELGYDQAGAPEVPVFAEMLTVNGSILVNAERQELSLSTRVDLVQLGGRLTAKGGASLDGSKLDVNIKAEELELASVDSYLLTLFPSLSIGTSSTEAEGASGLPLLAGQVKRAELQVQQQPGQELSIDGRCEFENLRFTSSTLPELYLPYLTSSYTSSSGAINTDLALRALGCVVSGKPEINLIQQTLAGKLKVDCADPADLLKQFGGPNMTLEGAISANVELAGTFEQPALVMALRSDRLKLQQLDLGQLHGSITLSQSWLKLDEVQCSGGTITFSAEGGIDTSSLDGRIGLNAGPLPIGEVLAVANQLKDGEPLALDAKGNISAALEILLKAGEPTVMLHAWSDQFTVAGQRFRQMNVRADVAPPNVKLKEAEATLVLEQTVNMAGFTSDGPLQLALRAGGSVSTVPGQEQMALAIVGEGLTKNLAPEAIRLSFKILGSATDPEIRLQLKTTESAQPLVLSAQGHYGTGFTPWSANLLWQKSTVQFAGKLDLEGQRIQGDVTASEISLERFSGDERLGGVFSATIAVGGTFQAPTASGTVSAPQLTFATPEHTYSVDGLAAAVELTEGNSLKASDGAFTFEGNKFTAAGVLGQSGGDLTLKCPDFDLFSVLVLAQPSPGAGGKSAYSRPPLEIESAGPLTVRLTGELTSPQAAIEYSSGPGQVAGHAFTSTQLKASADLKRAVVDSLRIASSSGSITADGVVDYEPLTVEAAVKVQQFDVAVLAPLSGIPSLGDLKGQLNGNVSVNSSQGALGVKGWLELTGGIFQGVAITRARAELSTAGGFINIDNAVIEAANTSLTASGKIGATPSQTQISARAPSLDLALLAPFIAADTDKPFGTVALDLDISPSTGETPQVDVNVSSIGGRVGAGEIGFDSLQAHVILDSGTLRVQSCNLVTGESSLNLTARLDMAMFQRQDERALPLDITLGSNNFNLSDARALLPRMYQGYVPGGVVTCENIRVKGTTTEPNVSGELSFDISEMPASAAYLTLIQRAHGRVRFTPGEFDIRQLELTPVGSSGVGGVMRVSGSAAYSLSPLALTAGQLTLELAPGGQYMRLNTNDVDPQVFTGASEGELPLQFDGWLGGTVTINASSADKDIAAIVSGQLAVNMDGQTSALEMPRSEKATGESQTIPVLLDEKRGLAIKIQSGTKLFYDRGNSPGQLDLRADLVGDITLYGQPGQLDARRPHPFRITGDISLLKGSMRFYRHFVRLDDVNSRLAFTGSPGEVYPYLTTRGSMVLPRVLTGNETIETSGTQLSTTPSASGSRDLTIFFAFTKHKLDPTVYYTCSEHPDVRRNSPGTCPIDGKELKREDHAEAMQLSSEPPMSEEKILTYLLGGAIDVLTGSGDLGQFAEGELIGFGSSFISQAIADEFNLAALRLGGSGSEDNPYYIDMEKAITPDFSVTYYRDFFSETSQTEEYGVRYKILESQQGSRYDGIELELNFQDNSFTGPESEFMFTWTMRF